jgi:hypothetical protein
MVLIPTLAAMGRSTEGAVEIRMAVRKTRAVNAKLA